MSKWAFYNENDPFAAQWLRNLIEAGHIAPGVVDERSIAEVSPDDVRGFAQCHFFAGIGVWSYALRLAGWPDDRPVWTGSCPCQPFSVAGKRKGLADERHLWPAWLRLIEVQRPESVFGEQVANGDGAAWFDHVASDLESLGYAVGAVSAPACGFGAPHERQRLYFVADNDRMGRRGRGSGEAVSEQGPLERPERCSDAGIVEHASGRGFGERGDASQPGRGGHTDGAEQFGLMGNTFEPRLEGLTGHEHDREESGRLREDAAGPVAAPSGPCNGFWSDAEWIACTDGKARPAFTRLQFVAHGVTDGLVCRSTTEEKEVDHGLQTLRKTTEAKTLQQRGVGIAVDAQAPQVLQPALHGVGDDRRDSQSERQEQPEAVCEEGGAMLQDMWRHIASRCSPYRQQSSEQRAIQSSDVVRVLSHEATLAGMEGDYTSAEALSALLNACETQRAVQLTLHAVQKIWRSACCEGKTGNPMGSGYWRTIAASPLAINVSNRVGILRGAGNAITASQAAEFVKAYAQTQTHPHTLRAA